MPAAVLSQRQSSGEVGRSEGKSWRGREGRRMWGLEWRDHWSGVLQTVWVCCVEERDMAEIR